MDGALRAIHRKSFDPRKKLDVMFSDGESSEGAIDEGGPTREMLRLLVKQIQNLQIFEGSINQRCLSLNSLGTVDKCLVSSLAH